MSAWPLELTYISADRTLKIAFDDGTAYTIPAELLRIESPSAEVQGHSPSQKQIVACKANVGISNLESVGNYAIRISFDDGHNTGIYTWDYLAKLGREQERIWSDYLKALEAAGLSR